jgi:hypothetical protein
MTTARYAPGTEWTDTRGKVYVSSPDHPNARKDGFVLRARLEMEKAIGRQLTKDERVLHWPNEDPGDDDTTEVRDPKKSTYAKQTFDSTEYTVLAWHGNLMLFPDQANLHRFRVCKYAERKANGHSNGPVNLKAALTAILDKDYEAQELDGLLIDGKKVTMRELTAFRMAVEAVQADVANALEEVK